VLRRRVNVESIVRYPMVGVTSLGWSSFGCLTQQSQPAPTAPIHRSRCPTDGDKFTQPHEGSEVCKNRRRPLSRYHDSGVLTRHAFIIFAVLCASLLVWPRFSSETGYQARRMKTLRGTCESGE
jgi:hypothetical protein